MSIRLLILVVDIQITKSESFIKMNMKCEGEEAESVRRTTVATTVSLPVDLRAKAEERAASEQRSLSSYLQWLIAQDVKRVSEMIPENSAN